MITIKKAQKNLVDFVNGDFQCTIKELNESARLGVEAMAEVEKARMGDPALDGELLPGEEKY